MKKILLFLIAIPSISLMGMDQHKQIIPLGTPPAYAPPAPSALYASTLELLKLQNQRSQNNKVATPSCAAQSASRALLCALCTITGLFDVTTSPFCCLNAATDTENDHHRRHSHFTHYFCCCTRSLLHQAVEGDTACGLNTNIPSQEITYAYGIRPDTILVSGDFS